MGGVDGEVEAGSAGVVDGVAALFGGGEATTEDVCDLTGGFGGRGDDAYVGAPR
ncbi:hypothetical protein SAZ_21665 [Streptomyces noursei ZPM]|nr:hypothetical protein SAZ_21665 [Streptomyces noursei ZPM]EPY93228.1 hypothetical protein K530_49095 [Streptomyces noursei CCRC 11814]